MGIVDKIHKLFKTDTYKLKVILSKDIQDEVDFVKFHEDYGDTIDDHFDRRFVYPLHDVRDAIKERNAKKAIACLKKAKITIPELEKFFDKEIFDGGSRLRKVPLVEVLKQRNQYSYTGPKDAMLTIDAVLSESLRESGTSELVESSIIRLLVEDSMDKNEADNVVIDRHYDKIPKEWHPVLKHVDEIEAIAKTVYKKYETLCNHLLELVVKYFNEAVAKYYDPKK